LNIFVQKSHGTVTKFTEVLSNEPNGIHFSGHGEEQALILEADDCSAIRLFRSDIKEKLQQL
jgi:hypothetical protein